MKRLLLVSAAFVAMLPMTAFAAAAWVYLWGRHLRHTAGMAMVGQLKTMVLRSGNYTIGIRAPGRTPFEQRIYVVAEKTMKLHPDLRLQVPSAPSGS